jgi:hypothetical protein
MLREKTGTNRFHRETWGNSRLSEKVDPYLSPVRFLPSIMTFLNIRLIRVWYPGPLDLNQSTTSISTRNEILRLRGRFQRASASPSSSASNNRSSSTDARSSRTFPGRARAFRRFVFLVLAVMTQSYTPHRHDVMFLQEHFPYFPTWVTRGAVGPFVYYYDLHLFKPAAHLLVG